MQRLISFLPPYCISHGHVRGCASNYAHIAVQSCDYLYLRASIALIESEIAVNNSPELISLWSKWNRQAVGIWIEHLQRRVRVANLNPALNISTKEHES